MCTSGDPMWTSSCSWNVFLYNFLYCFSSFILIVLLWVHSSGQCVQANGRWRKMTRKGNNSATKTKIVILAFLGLFLLFLCRGICYADGKMAYSSLSRDSWYMGWNRLRWSCSGEALWWCLELEHGQPWNRMTHGLQTRRAVSFYGNCRQEPLLNFSFRDLLS